MTDVAIIDYQLCNLDSICRAVEECGGKPTFARKPSDLESCHRIILPGVGSFAHAMANLDGTGFREALPDIIGTGVPTLGICLGMQLLAKWGTEGGDTAGLGVLEGKVSRLSPQGDERIPHIGWNNISIDLPSPLFDGVADQTDFYFVHSFGLECPAEQTIATVDYCGPTVAATRRDNVMAVQFHPEKSQTAGFRLLRNFLTY